MSVERCFQNQEERERQEIEFEKRERPQLEHKKPAAKEEPAVAEVAEEETVKYQRQQKAEAEVSDAGKMTIGKAQVSN
jgi:hypothetical protein